MAFRIGFGYDVHKLSENEELILGGIKIPHYKGTVAHSDGDVLIHAICDALLGAANMRDIGYHFPDTSKEYEDIASTKLLRKTIEIIGKRSYRIGNIDCTICAQSPKLSGFIPQMISVLSSVMNVSEDYISIKATTTEKMGFVGKEKGISVYVVVLIEK